MRALGAWMDAIGVDDGDVEQRRRLRDAERLRTAGRVISLRPVAGRIEGRVQGTHARPHLVELGVAQWTDEQWHAVSDLLAAQARHYARLLAGQLPDQFDDGLTRLGLSLMPRAEEWRLACTCGQPSPCVHQIAVWLEVRERLEGDPYLLTRLRGRSREQLLAEIRDQRSTLDTGSISIDRLRPAAWSRARALPSDVPLPPVRRPVTAAGPLQMLGDPPGWAGPASAVTLFRPDIVAAGERARQLLDDDPDPPQPGSGDLL